MEPAQIKAFSTRSNQIEERLQAQGQTRGQVSAERLQMLALQTRQAKTEVDREALKAEWQDRAAAVALNFERADPRQAQPVDRQFAALQAVSRAVAELGERDAVLNRVDLLRASLEHGVGRTDLVAVEAALGEAVKRGELIQAGERFTTPAAQQREKEILAMESAGRGQRAPTMDTEAVRQALAGKALNPEQAEVVRQVLTSPHHITGVQGSAGTGKTTTLRAVRELVQAQGLKPVGVAPSAGAARELSATGMPSQTLAALAARDYAGLNKDSLVVLDEAGMVSSKDMHGLLKAATQAGARVVLVGDVHQLKAVEAGRPFEQLQSHGMDTAHLKEIQRQKVPELKEAVRLAAEGQALASFDQLRRMERSVVEVERHQDRHAQMAATYAALSAEDREKTRLVAGTHHHREAINARVREQLGMAGRGQTHSTFSRKDMSQAQALRTVSYQAGDVVRAERDYKTLGLQKGDMAQVIDGRAGVVTLQYRDAQGHERQVEWRPANHPHFTAYTEHQRELAVGDLVRVTRNDYSRGLVNGELATVVVLPQREDPQIQGQAQAQGPEELVLRKADGSEVALAADRALFLEHGYCQTVHAAQGQTCERILIEMPAQGGMGNEASYYVAISRATHAAVIYTDDAQRLPEILMRADEKSAALDVETSGLDRGVGARSAPEMEMG